MIGLFRERRRRRIRQYPIPDSWRTTLESTVPLYGTLSDAEKRVLHGHMNVLLAEKRLVGCDGLELTDAMNAIIAGQACMLMLARDFRYFPRLGSVLVYPGDFIVNHATHTEWGLVVEEELVHSGESWSTGTVILSWREVERDMARGECRNVVLHEFAHQVDQEDGASDGWPRHLPHALRQQWYEVMRGEYGALCQRVAEGRRTAIDPYGATHPAEFFAVVTEMFFMAPQTLRTRHADLYDLFRIFYGQDPASRVPPTGG